MRDQVFGTKVFENSILHSARIKFYTDTPKLADASRRLST